MTVEELLDQIDDMIDKAWSFPLSGGRCVVDANHLRDIIDDIRGNIPSEVRQARATGPISSRRPSGKRKGLCATPRNAPAA